MFEEVHKLCLTQNQGLQKKKKKKKMTIKLKYSCLCVVNRNEKSVELFV